MGVQFSVLELLALFGVVQSVFIMVHILFRAWNIKRVFVPVLFFTNLFLIFLMVSAQSRWENHVENYEHYIWAFYTICAPVSLVLVLQLSRLNQTPPLWSFLSLLLVPVGYGIVMLLATQGAEANVLLYLASILIGGISLLQIWVKRDWLDGVLKRKFGRERWWLIMSIISLNICLMITYFLYSYGALDKEYVRQIQIILGLSFIYVAFTSVLRLYPQAFILDKKQAPKEDVLSPLESDIALKIEDLIYLQKVYQEPAYGRKDMAKELDINESTLSKIVKIYFKHSVPTLLNTYRVEEAKALLRQTQEDITIISQEAGFNSIATFNRVFKEIEGVTPSFYREAKK